MNTPKRNRYLQIKTYAYQKEYDNEPGESGYQCCTICMSTNNKQEAYRWYRRWMKRNGVSFSVYDTVQKRNLII